MEMNNNDPVWSAIFFALLIAIGIFGDMIMDDDEKEPLTTEEKAEVIKRVARDCGPPKEGDLAINGYQNGWYCNKVHGECLD